jgi:hypothetical protein
MSSSPCFKTLKEEYPGTYKNVTNWLGFPTDRLLESAMGKDYQKDQSAEDNCIKLLENLRIAMADTQIAPPIQEVLSENLAQLQRTRPPMKQPDFLIPVPSSAMPEILELPPAAKRRRLQRLVSEDDDDV